jgi:hypothetical protein
MYFSLQLSIHNLSTVLAKTSDPYEVTPESDLDDNAKLHPLALTAECFDHKLQGDVL